MVHWRPQQIADSHHRCGQGSITGGSIPKGQVGNWHWSTLSLFPSAVTRVFLTVCLLCGQCHDAVALHAWRGGPDQGFPGGLQWGGPPAVAAVLWRERAWGNRLASEAVYRCNDDHEDVQCFDSQWALSVGASTQWVLSVDALTLSESWVSVLWLSVSPECRCFDSQWVLSVGALTQWVLSISALTQWVLSVGALTQWVLSVSALTQWVLSVGALTLSESWVSVLWLSVSPERDSVSPECCFDSQWALSIGALTLSEPWVSVLWLIESWALMLWLSVSPECQCFDSVSPDHWCFDSQWALSVGALTLSEPWVSVLWL